MQYNKVQYKRPAAPSPPAGPCPHGPGSKRNRFGGFSRSAGRTAGHLAGVQKKSARPQKGARKKAPVFRIFRNPEDRGLVACRRGIPGSLTPKTQNTPVTGRKSRRFPVDGQPGASPVCCLAKPFPERARPGPAQCRESSLGIPSAAGFPLWAEPCSRQRVHLRAAKGGHLPLRLGLPRSPCRRLCGYKKAALIRRAAPMLF